MNKRSRRSFLIRSTSGLSSIWLASHWSGILDAAAHAEQAARKAVSFSFFTKEQAAEVDAVASQIIPTDDTPGAHEARCVFFIDRALTTFLRESQPVYTQGLQDLQAKTKEVFPSASKFSALTSAQQIQLLTAIEHTPFFAAVRMHTIAGMFAGPIHGGNCDKAGWKLIGFEDTLDFKPPFGYYDAISKPT
jgi:Gluconate 2-dehydrogenase subunit 3